MYLQIDQGKNFSSLGKKNFLKTEMISPVRVNLLDCKGVLLAANRPVFYLYWQGSGSYHFSSSQKDIIKKLENIFKINFDHDLIRTVRIAQRNAKRVLLKSDISFEELCCISEQCADSFNLVIKNRFKRIYPYRKLASHVLGYLSRREEEYTTIGLYGLEKIFQDKLKGEVGYVLNVINSKGSKLRQKDFKNAKAGSDITLTLDWQLQAIAENLFEKDQAGAFALMDPLDGSIRALVSYPNFDPNIFLEPISQKD